MKKRVCVEFMQRIHKIYTSFSFFYLHLKNHIFIGNLYLAKNKWIEPQNWELLRNIHTKKKKNNIL